MRLIVLLKILFFISNSFSNEISSSISLLNNRFRVDPAIKQITFIIYRTELTQPVILIRPDGKKYYSWKKHKNVHWYHTSDMDIISIDKPMPGPWQAIGKVTPKNKIKLISNLTIETDPLPSHFFNGETIKFTARLLNDRKPLLLEDFLEELNLNITFTKFLEKKIFLFKKKAQSAPKIIEQFSDDGRGLDEYPRDGVFTVPLLIKAKPGKYKVRITSGNGIFLRAREQETFIYPNPIQIKFIQSEQEETPHRIVFSGKNGTIVPGSLAASITYHNKKKNTITTIQGMAKNEDTKLTIELENKKNIRWYGHVYANDIESNRPLSFIIPEQNQSILQTEEQKENNRIGIKVESEKKIKHARNIIVIIVGNSITILLGLTCWFFLSREQKK
ncbi:hypothetical protein CF66_9084 [Candidatus Photodesmus katoptron]|uniref:TIGR03503 family protein n=1 Tax=Candidatus Photodesmus anomalopis TaxID=28176 RepID=UPI0004D5E329|nr:TIGR03503 family protein [Candidatus Photodesmus katoptron]KEY90047.1 hypothetical protein CF66_9084 [Candidatus Photodesmus katoptron]